MAKQSDDDFSYVDPDIVDEDFDEDYDEDEEIDVWEDYSQDEGDNYEDYYEDLEEDSDVDIDDENESPSYDSEENKEDEDISLEDAKDLADNIEQQAKGSKNDEILEYNRQHMGDTNTQLQQLDVKDVKLDTETTGKLAGKSAKKAGIEGGKKATAKAGGAGAKGAMAGLKALLTNPWFWIIVGIILVLILIIVGIIALVMAAQAPFGNIDLSTGRFDTASGIQGDKFYGARIVYYDDDQAFKDMQKYYLSLSSDFLFSIDEIDGIDFNTGLSNANSDNQNNENFVLGIEKNLATALMVEIIEVMDGLDVELSLSFGETLSEEKRQLVIASVNNIKHFGYNSNELSLINTALSDYININKNNIFSFYGSYTSNFRNDISSIFTNKYSNLNIVVPKYYVKDAYLRTATNMINGLTAENYLAFIYMPNSEVKITEAEYLFYVADENTKVNYNICYQHDTQQDSYGSNTVDSTWYDGVNSTTAVAEDINVNLNQFQSIIKDNEQLLEEGCSIYSLLFNNSNFINTDFTIINQLFKTIDVSDEGLNYKEISYLPALDTNYLYLTFDSNGIFNFCEFTVEYK